MPNTILDNLTPEEIERRSFEIITAELGPHDMPPSKAAVVKRVIHTTADFDYFRTLHFSEGAVEAGISAMRQGVSIVTDTRMAQAGINKAACSSLGCEVHCFIGDADVRQISEDQGVTRSRAAVDKAVAQGHSGIYVVGNAPTALIRIAELIHDNRIAPKLVVAVPVGFVHVIESKELIMCCAVPYIVAEGRKGGSNVAAAIINALLYQAIDKENDKG